MSAQPLPMILYCPGCGAQHIDAPDVAKGWENPPHRSHECQACGYVWRPADVPTAGVARLATRGQRDSSDHHAGAPITRFTELCRIIYTPERDDFIRGVSIEAEHQRQRWPESDRRKTPLEWAGIILFLAGKAIRACLDGDLDKAKHHAVSTAAALLNWHRRLVEAGLR